METQTHCIHTGGSLQENALSKGIMKEKVIELLVVGKKGGCISTNGPKRHMLGF